MNREQRWCFAVLVGEFLEKGDWRDQFWSVACCVNCDASVLCAYTDLTCRDCEPSQRKGELMTDWVGGWYFEDLKDYWQALRLLPQPIWEEIEPEFAIPFKAWRESKLSTAPKNTDGTTPTLLQLWRRDLGIEAVPTVAPFAEIQEILTPSAGADSSVEGARPSTLPQPIPPQCTARFY